MMKKILIVSRSFYPTLCPRAFRTTELAKEFAKMGHNVKVICSYADNVNYTKLSKKYNIKFKNLGTQKLKFIKLRGNKLLDFFIRVINRLLLMAFEYPDIQLVPKVIKSLENEKNYDIIISIAVPHPIHWGVSISRFKNNNLAKIWVADCGDPYFGCKLDTFNKWFYFKYIEKWTLEKADFISIPIDGAKSAYLPEFHSKIRVIPQGFDLTQYNICKNFISNDIPTFAYAGGFIVGKRDPNDFLKFLCKLEIDFKFIVYTKKKNLFFPYINQLAEKIEIRDYIDRKKLIMILSKMDFLVNFDNNNHEHLPSKLIDYAITKRPILNIKNKIEEENIIKFLNKDYSSKLKIKSIDYYNIENVAKKFINIK